MEFITYVSAMPNFGIAHLESDLAEMKTGIVWSGGLKTSASSGGSAAA